MVATPNNFKGPGVAPKADEPHPAFTMTSKEYAHEIYRDVVEDEKIENFLNKTTFPKRGGAFPHVQSHPSTWWGRSPRSYRPF